MLLLTRQTERLGLTEQGTAAAIYDVLKNIICLLMLITAMKNF